MSRHKWIGLSPFFLFSLTSESINACIEKENIEKHAIRSTELSKDVDATVCARSLPWRFRTYRGNEFDAFLVNDFNRGIKLECAPERTSGASLSVDIAKLHFG